MIMSCLAYTTVGTCMIFYNKEQTTLLKVVELKYVSLIMIYGTWFNPSCSLLGTLIFVCIITI